MKSSTAAEVIPPATIAPQVNGSTGIAATRASALATGSPPVTAAVLSKKLIDPVSQKTSMMPSTTPQSPTRLATNAFLAASPASWRSK
jgi:hypothetical protein